MIISYYIRDGDRGSSAAQFVDWINLAPLGWPLLARTTVQVSDDLACNIQKPAVVSVRNKEMVSRNHRHRILCERSGF